MKFSPISFTSNILKEGTETMITKKLIEIITLITAVTYRGESSVSFLGDLEAKEFLVICYRTSFVRKDICMRFRAHLQWGSVP